MLSRITKNIWTGLAILAVSLQSAAAGPELRLAGTYQDAPGARLFAGAWYFAAPSWTRASRMEVAVGLLDGSGRTRPFVSAGPVWRLNDVETPGFVEFGLSPTVLAVSTLGSRDLGGNLHFTSSLAVGRDFQRGRLVRVALRIQHLSNGGLYRVNPGLDLIGVSFIGRLGAP